MLSSPLLKSCFDQAGAAAMATTRMAKFIPIGSAGPEYSNHGELAIIYCWFLFFAFFYGPGRWSIDALFGRRSTQAGR